MRCEESGGSLRLDGSNPARRLGEVGVSPCRLRLLLLGQEAKPDGQEGVRPDKAHELIDLDRGVAVGVVLGEGFLR